MFNMEKFSCGGRKFLYGLNPSNDERGFTEPELAIEIVNH